MCTLRTPYGYTIITLQIWSENHYDEAFYILSFILKRIICQAKDDICFDGFLCYHCSMTKTQGDGEFSGFNEFLCDAMTKRHYFPQFPVSLIGSIITNYM